MATPANWRKIRIVTLGASLLALFVALATLNAFNTQLPTPATTQQIVIFTGLSIVAKTYDDVTAFRVAAAHEERFPWLDQPSRRPAL